MKKVGIITSYLDFNKNYGGILQGYALAQTVKDMGYEAYIMPYVYEFLTQEKGSQLRELYRIMRRTLTECMNSEVRKQNTSFRNIMKFVRKELPIYPSKSTGIAELKRLSLDFHAFICGSDQVWSTKLQRDHCDPGMFLTFLPNGIKKIAYAPSLGSTLEMNEETAKEFAEAVLDFDAVSAREVSGQKVIKKITGLEAPIVLDPTLLLPVEQWERFMQTPARLPEKYILLYRFGKNMTSTEKAIADVQATMNLPIIELPSSLIAMGDKYEKRYDINPAQFIGMIKNATLVLTDSFHCTVFSILMKSQFLTFYRQSPGEKANMNSRVDDLLKMTNLTNRLIKPGDLINYQTISKEEFDMAHKLINDRKDFSYSYLRTALQ